MMDESFFWDILFFERECPTQENLSILWPEIFWRVAGKATMYKSWILSSHGCVIRSQQDTSKEHTASIFSVEE
jgi:hypothetical protein